jgi:hypothetical protein
MASAGFEVQWKQFATCIYRPNSGFDIERLESEIADEYMEGFFSGYRICHHSKSACCAGFWRIHKNDFAAGQIAHVSSGLTALGNGTVSRRITNRLDCRR